MTINTEAELVSNIEAEMPQPDEAFDPAAHAATMVGHHYRVGDYYEVGREKVREYARAVQDYHPVHWDEDVAQEYGYDGLVAPSASSPWSGSWPSASSSSRSSPATT